MQTRRGNKLAHPGLVDAPRPRRSSAQVKADNEAKAASKAAAAEERLARLRNITAFEEELYTNEAKQQDSEAKLSANSSGITLQLRRITPKDTEEQGSY